MFRQLCLFLFFYIVRPPFTHYSKFLGNNKKSRTAPGQNAEQAGHWFVVRLIGVTRYGPYNYDVFIDCFKSHRARNKQTISTQSLNWLN